MAAMVLSTATVAEGGSRHIAASHSTRDGRYLFMGRSVCRLWQDHTHRHTMLMPGPGMTHQQQHCSSHNASKRMHSPRNQTPPAAACISRGSSTDLVVVQLSGFPRPVLLVPEAVRLQGSVGRLDPELVLGVVLRERTRRRRRAPQQHVGRRQVVEQPGNANPIESEQGRTTDDVQPEQDSSSSNDQIARTKSGQMETERGRLSLKRVGLTAVFRKRCRERR